IQSQALYGLVAGTIAYYLWVKPSHDLKKEQQARELLVADSNQYVEKRKPVADPQVTGLIYMETRTKLINHRRILSSLLIISLSSISNVSSDQIFPAHLVGTFSRNNREPKYTIEFLPEDAPFHPGDNLESMVMLDKQGRRFLCFLPKEEESTTGWASTQQNMSTVLMETDKQLKLKTPDELLQPLNDQCLLRQEGWWSYEFCHLGYTLRMAIRYHSHIFTNGTTCDLTGTPREVEVRFVCAETRAMVTSITELSTCKYALTVQCPTLCKHPLFQLEKPVSHTIHCNLIPQEEDASRNEEERVVGESPKVADS
ncbi:hypothetical protein HID58_017733, partial [Brassica napus]